MAMPLLVGLAASIDVQRLGLMVLTKLLLWRLTTISLLVFGEHSIIVYGGADSPASMSIQDTISGVGCIDRKTVQNIGTDLLFLSDDGLRSLGRNNPRKVFAYNRRKP